MENLNQCPVCGFTQLEEYKQVEDYFLSKEKFTLSKCKECGFVFTNPRPDRNKLGMYYQSAEYISHSNSSKGFLNGIYQFVKSYTLRKKFRLINQYSSGKNILDIGCATGEFLNVFKVAGWNTKGIEPAESARNFAKTAYKLDVTDEDTIALIESESMDIVTLWHVLEHVPQLKERVQEIKRILKPSGYAFIALPNINSFDSQYYDIHWAALDVPRHLYHFNKSAFSKLLEKVDLELVEILPMKFDSFYVSLLSEKYKRGKSNYFGALWVGLKSNFKALNTGEYSSLIYVVKKKS